MAMEVANACQFSRTFYADVPMLLLMLTDFQTTEVERAVGT